MGSHLIMWLHTTQMLWCIAPPAGPKGSCTSANICFHTENVPTLSVPPKF